MIVLHALSRPGFQTGALRGCYTHCWIQFNIGFQSISHQLFCVLTPSWLCSLLSLFQDIAPTALWTILGIANNLHSNEWPKRLIQTLWQQPSLKGPYFFYPVCVHFTVYCLLCYQQMSTVLCLILLICCCLYRCVSRWGIIGSCQSGKLCRAELQSQSYVYRSHHPKPLSSACGGVGAPRFQRSHPHQIWSVCSSSSSKLQG